MPDRPPIPWLSEELLNLLAKLPDLRAMGRTSSFQFKGRRLTHGIVGDPRFKAFLRKLKLPE